MYGQFHDQVNHERRSLGLRALTSTQTRTIYDQLYPGDAYGDTSTIRLLGWLGQRAIRSDAAQRVLFAAVDGTNPQPPFGAAPGLPIVNERPSSAIVNQEHGMSCAAACARQILQDVGHPVSEAIVRGLAGTTLSYGTRTAQGRLADALNQLDPRGTLVL